MVQQQPRQNAHQPQPQPQPAGPARRPAPAAAALAIALLLQLSACSLVAARSNVTLDGGIANLRVAGLRSRCGHDHDDAEYAQARQSIAAVQRMGALNYNARVAFSDSVTVPTSFHVLVKADGTGNVTMARIQAQMTELNKAFSPHFSFLLQGVDYITSDLWYSDAS